MDLECELESLAISMQLYKNTHKNLWNSKCCCQGQ